MIGDGATDMQARPPADLFVGYGGVVQRQVVKEGADLFVTDLTVSFILYIGTVAVDNCLVILILSSYYFIYRK